MSMPTPVFLQIHERHLVYLAPFQVATSATGALLVFSGVVIGIVKFFQAFDPTPPPSTSKFGSSELIIGATIVLIAVFAALAITCILFNWMARLSGSIRYRTTGTPSLPE